MSFGITICHNIKSLRNICQKISQRGTIIISAFDNDGSISYPASFDEVIGVDMNPDISNIYDFEYNINSRVNIRGIGVKQRVLWGDKMTSMYGASFTVPYIASFIGKMMEQRITSYNSVNRELISCATRVNDFPKSEIDIKDLNIKTASLFPFGKEIQTLYRYNDLCNFEIKNIYDLPYSGNVNKIAQSNNRDIIIKNIQCLKKDKIDTLVLGHLDKYINLIGTTFLDSIVRTCVEQDINIFALDVFGKLNFKHSENNFSSTSMVIFPIRYADTTALVNV